MFLQADGLTRGFPVNPQRIIENVLAVHLVPIPGGDEMNKGVQANASLATLHVLQQHHLNWQAIEWVLVEIEAKLDQSPANPGELCDAVDW
ncbi:hypothetical protein BS17DRAFT_880248 [Gyrodon lividus]|nr:hypothetical protein BS17DRAFT_880248 [Gyrodon lividus]